jgi:hypothetical protein
MDCIVAMAANRDQVVIAILSTATAEAEVMHFN